MTGLVSDIFATHLLKRQNLGARSVLGVSDREVTWLKVAYYATITSCKLKRKRLNCKIDKEEASRKEDFPETDSLELLLQHAADGTQTTIVVDLSVASA